MTVNILIEKMKKSARAAVLATSSALKIDPEDFELASSEARVADDIAVSALRAASDARTAAQERRYKYEGYMLIEAVARATEYLARKLMSMNLDIAAGVIETRMEHKRAIESAIRKLNRALAGK